MTKVPLNIGIGYFSFLNVQTCFLSIPLNADVVLEKLTIGRTHV